MTLSKEELENVVHTWEDEYHYSISPNKFLRYYLLRSHPTSDQGSSLDPNFNDIENKKRVKDASEDCRYLEYLIKPNITFNKLYFRGKEEIVKRGKLFIALHVKKKDVEGFILEKVREMARVEVKNIGKPTTLKTQKFSRIPSCGCTRWRNTAGKKLTLK